MKLATKYHGQIEMSDQEIISFEKGIPGFPDEKKFIVLPLSEDAIFQVLQSFSTPQLAFVMTNPFHFFKEYDFDLEEAAVKELEITSEEDVQVYSILTVQDPFEKTTANLQAPVIINSKNKKSKQVILTDTLYTTKHPIFSGSPAEDLKG